MKTKSTMLNSVLVPVSNALAAALFLSGCETLYGSPDTKEELQTTSAEADMRSECMTIHEQMKAKMAEGGMAMDESQMSSDMKAKMEQCMKMMPEMREECETMHEGGMEGHCMGMMHQDETDAHAPKHGEHQ